MPEELTLSGESILLRPYRVGDAGSVHRAALESFPELSPWMPWCHAGYTLQESEAWTKSCAEMRQSGTAYEFAILDSHGGEYIGGCGLNHIDPVYKVANLGYWVRSKRTKHGIATEATLLLARFGFETLKFNRIEIVAAAGNKASQRVAEKAGAKREGILRNRIVVGENIYDAVMFSFIPRDL